METDSHRWIVALRRSQDRLASLIAPLTPEQLHEPSYHDWTIAQVLGHIGSQAEIFDGWVTAALNGTEPAGSESLQRIWDAWESRSPHAQVVDALAFSERLVERFEGLQDDKLERMHLNLFGMELGPTGLPRLRLAEHALHTWDVSVAHDPSAQVAPDAVELLIDTLGLLVGRIGKPQGKSFQLRIHTGDPERNFVLRVDDEVELSQWDGEASDGEMRISAEAFIRLVYGRLDPDHTPHVELSGPVSLDELRRVFPGV
jgi:uncharacterized protein (TIGR03083 family)